MLCFDLRPRADTGKMLIDNGLELLTESECLDLLATENVGRVGVSVSALPAIFPVNYLLDGGDIVFRTGEGTKLRAAADRAVVGFEVDHFDAATGDGWSVLIVGLARIVPDVTGHPSHRAPTPAAAGNRPATIRLHPELISGRRLVKDVTFDPGT